MTVHRRKNWQEEFSCPPHDLATRCSTIDNETANYGETLKCRPIQQFAIDSVALRKGIGRDCSLPRTLLYVNTRNISARNSTLDYSRARIGRDWFPAPKSTRVNSAQPDVTLRDNSVGYFGLTIV
jgi:hypothetical protein